MALPNINPTTTKAWKKLESHFEAIKNHQVKSFFEDDSNRAKDLTIKWEDFYVDYSKNRITGETVKLLLELADEVGLKTAMSQYFGGEVINATEGREVLHTALRNPKSAQVLVEGKDVMPEIYEVKDQIKTFSRAGY